MYPFKVFVCSLVYSQSSKKRVANGQYLVIWNKIWTLSLSRLHPHLAIKFKKWKCHALHVILIHPLRKDSAPSYNRAFFTDLNPVNEKRTTDYIEWSDMGKRLGNPFTALSDASFFTHRFCVFLFRQRTPWWWHNFRRGPIQTSFLSIGARSRSQIKRAVWIGRLLKVQFKCYDDKTAE